MRNNCDVDMPAYVAASGFQHTRLIIEAYRAYWQGCNDGDAAWVEIPEPPPEPVPVEQPKQKAAKRTPKIAP